MRFRLKDPQPVGPGRPAPQSRPVFIGGTGRSGTTIVAKLLGAHPAFHMIPIEVRFVVGRDGLCDLLEGRTTFGTFRRKMLGTWYRDELDGVPRGLHKVLERAVVEDALRTFGDDLDRDPWAAGRDLVHRLLDPMAAASGASGWIEMTPRNVRAAHSLGRLFRDLRLVHMVRDGRDVAASVAPLWWGPNDLDAGLDWWAARLERGFAACDPLAPDQVLVLQMEDLVAHDREGSYARLLTFLALDDAAEMRTFQTTLMTADRAHIGRWTEVVAPDRQATFEDHYVRLVDQLRARGRPVPAGDFVAAR